MAGRDDERFRAFVLRRSPDLLRTAYLLTGDRGHAEDLLQTALMKTYRHWERVENKEDPGAFVHRVMVTTQVTTWRRRRVQERITDQVPDAAQDTATPGDQDEMWPALAQLPPRMRAVLVLRYWEDLSEAETAHVLGCSVGTVKSQASRGLARLRSRLSRQPHNTEQADVFPKGLA